MFKYHNLIASTSLALAAAGGYYLAYHHYAPSVHTTQSHSALTTMFRKLYAEQTVWTRNYIVAATTDHADRSPAADRLLLTQKELGYALIPFYGKEAGHTVAALLQEHATLLMAMLAARKNDNQTTADDAERQWHEQAHQIATFLAHENKAWEYDTLMALLDAQMMLTNEEMNARLHKAWKEDIVAFSKAFDQALTIADYISNGLLQQFPHKFAS